MKEVIDRNMNPVNKLILARTVPVSKLLLTGTLSNVRRYWLVMPLGAGVFCLVFTPPTCVYVLTIHKEVLAVAHFLP